MKYLKLIFPILIVFFKTETLLSENNLFNVNNIEIEKKAKITNNAIADQAIKKGFDQLIQKILLKEDINKLSNLKFSSIKKLVAYYQISNIFKENINKEFLNFSITFDKDKIHKLFYTKSVLYSDIFDKELYILPVLIEDNEINIFNNNFFYENWNEIYDNELIEFILPIENIEIIQNLNRKINNLIDLNLDDIFKEYSNKNLALVLIEESKNQNMKIYLKTKIQDKRISRSLNMQKQNLLNEQFYKNVIVDAKKELIDLVKSENQIDIRTPSFLKAKLDLNKRSNLVELNLRIKNIDSIENVYVQDFNKDYMNLRIKYLGKLQKIIHQLKNRKIDLKLINDQWVIKTL